MVENLDRHIGRLLAALEEMGVLDDTLVVFLSDNGAEGNLIGTMYDNEEIVPQQFDLSYENMGRAFSYVWTGPGWAQAQSAPFRLFKSLPYQGGVRTPAIFAHPTLVAREGMTEVFASAMDFVPTVLELAGVEHPRRFDGREVMPLQGRSLLPYLAGEVADVHGQEPVMGWELFGRRAILKGTWKLAWAWEPYGSERWELFDLARDPSEQIDLSEREPEKLAEMLAAWDAYAARNRIVLPPSDMGYGTVGGGR